MSKKNRPAATSARTEKVAALRASQARKDRRTKIALYSAVGLLTAAIAAGTAFGMKAQSDVNVSATPKNVNAVGAFVVKAADAAPKVTLDIYEDFQCPACGKFEAALGSVIKQAVADGTVRANYHVMSFLGPESDRAASAAGCAANAGKYAEFHDELYANQPVEHTGGYTHQDLRTAGKKVGITDPTFDKCVNTDAYAKWTNKVDTEAAKRGVTATPTVFINDKKFTYDGNPTTFVDALAAAAKN